MKQALLLVGGLTMLAACGGTSPNTSSAGGGAGSGSGISTGSTALGTVLTNPDGRTVYYFEPEKNSTVVCAADPICKPTWPPVTASGAAPTAPSGVTGTFGLVALPDGTQQVTYNGWPLHIYSGDSAAGQTNGQGIAGKWFAATPDLTASGSAGATSASGTPCVSYYNC